MKRIAILLFPIALFAQAPAITQGPYLGPATVSRSSASIAWATNVAADTEVFWSAVSAAAVTPTSCVSPSCNYSFPQEANSLQLWHNWYTAGTPGGSTIWYQVCSSTTPGTLTSGSYACAAGSYTSATQTTVPANPTLPAAVDSPTVPTGTIHTVGANCDDPNTGLVAMWTAAARGDIVEIDPAITPYCAGAYTFPQKPAGPPYILTRVKNAGATFPNYRRANLGDLPTAAGFAAGTNQMARFIHSAPDIAQQGNPYTGPCYPGDLGWQTGQQNAWAMNLCSNTNPQPIASVAQNGSAGHLWTIGSDLTSIVVGSGQATLTVTSTSGIASGYNLVIAGASNPAINGAWSVLYTINSTSFVVENRSVSPSVSGTFNNPGLTAWYSVEQLTVPGHGISNGASVYISGATGAGAGALNGLWQAVVVDPNTLQLKVPTNLSNSGPMQTSTGAVTLANAVIYTNAWSVIPAGTGVNQVTQGTANPPASSCTFGSWYHLQAGAGANDEYHRTWYCDGPNEWIQVRIDPNHSTVVTYPVIDIATNKLDHLMFQGLSFEPMHLAANPQLLEYKYLPSSVTGGNLYYQFVTSTIYNDHIYWDNILAGVPDPSLTGEMERIQNICQPCDGTQIHWGNSYFYGVQIFQSLQEVTDGSEQDPSVIQMTEGGPYELIDNYIECSGICVYAVADLDTMTDFHDLTVKRNTFSTPDKYWRPNLSLLSQGFYFQSRHRLETKRVQRMLLDGNIFLGGYVTVNQAAAICICYRTEQGLQTQSVTDNGTTTAVQGYDAGPTAYGEGWMFSDMAVNDWVVFISAPNGCPSIVGKLYQVTAVTDYTHFSITTTGCTGAGGLVTRLNPRTGNISDVTIQNTTFQSNPTDIAWLGHDSYPISQGGVLQRVKLFNNLSIGVDGTRVGQGSYYGAANPPSGSHLNLVEGGEDLQVLHETVIGRVGQYFESNDYGSGGSSAGSGLLMANNVFEYLNSSSLPGGPSFGDGVAYGAAFFNREWADLGGTSPSWTFSQNVILRQGGGGLGCGGKSYPLDPCAGPPWGPYPSGSVWYNTDSGPFPFYSYPQNNYRIQPKAPYASGGAKHATDGLAVGADIDALQAARGDVSNVRVFEISATAATVGFLAPDAVGCPVDWSANSFATYTRVPNAGGTRVQNVPLTGLPPNQPIAYRVDCVVMQPAGAFTTHPAP